MPFQLTSPKITRKTITFTGAAGAGAVGTVTVGTTTGEVIIKEIIPYCTTLLTEAAPGSSTLALGVTGSAELFIAATNSVDIDANEFWVDTAPDANGIALPAALKDILTTDNIILTVAVADVDSGVIEFKIVWEPISTDGKIA